MRPGEGRGEGASKGSLTTCPGRGGGAELFSPLPTARVSLTTSQVVDLSYRVFKGSCTSPARLGGSDVLLAETWLAYSLTLISSLIASRSIDVGIG